MDRNDPLRQFRFIVEIDQLKVGGFAEAMLGDHVVAVSPYREGSDPPHMRKLSGLTEYGNVTLKTGLTVGSGALVLFQWHQEVSAGNVKTQRKKVTITVQDEAGAQGARFVVDNAWPTKYHCSDLIAKGNEVLIEMLELANEGVERVS
jgi:phage tail-like protein